MKAKTLTHLETFSFPSNYTCSSTSLKTTVCSLDLVILFNQTNSPTHFSSLNLALLCELMEMYSQGRYTTTLKNLLKRKKKSEMYSLTSTISPLYFLFLFQNFSLSLSHILSGILGFPKLKIIFNLTNGLHIVRIVF